MSHIEVRRCGAPGTEQQRWRFWVDLSHQGIRLVLDAYWFETRPSTRHKFRHAFEGHYNRVDRREGGMAAHDVPQYKDVRYEVLEKAIALISIVVQDARGVEAHYAPEPSGEMEWYEHDQKWVAAHDKFMAKVRS